MGTGGQRRTEWGLMTRGGVAKIMAKAAVLLDWELLPYKPVPAGKRKRESGHFFSIAIASRPRAPDAG
jgi:hypothetical protein